MGCALDKESDGSTMVMPMEPQEPEPKPQSKAEQEQQLANTKEPPVESPTSLGAVTDAEQQAEQQTDVVVTDVEAGFSNEDANQNTEKATCAVVVIDPSAEAAVIANTNTEKDVEESRFGSSLVPPPIVTQFLTPRPDPEFGASPSNWRSGETSGPSSSRHTESVRIKRPNSAHPFGSAINSARSDRSSAGAGRRGGVSAASSPSRFIPLDTQTQIPGSLNR
jgi:hypothetical protein